MAEDVGVRIADGVDHAAGHRRGAVEQTRDACGEDLDRQAVTLDGDADEPGDFFEFLCEDERRTTRDHRHRAHAELREATDAVLDYSERRTRACLQALPDGEHSASDVLETADGDLTLRLTARDSSRRKSASSSAVSHSGNACGHEQPNGGCRC